MGNENTDRNTDRGTPAANAAGRERERGQPGGADRKRKTARGDGLGRLMEGCGGPGSRARESGPIVDGTYASPASSGAVEAGVALPVEACEATVDILHAAAVNASTTGVSNRRNPLPGKRLRPDSACGRWCVNTQAWVVIQTV